MKLGCYTARNSAEGQLRFQYLLGELKKLALDEQVLFAQARCRR